MTPGAAPPQRDRAAKLPQGLRAALQLVAALGGLVLAVLWLSGGCAERIAPGEGLGSGAAPAGGPSAVVERVIEPAIERVSGTVASARETAVSSKILARIEAIRVKAGSVVRAGDVLVELDARDLAARLAEAREALRAARSRLELARRERERLEKLFAANVASEEQLDQARSTFEVARAELRAAEQRVADAEVALSHAAIRSPVTGRVVDRLAEPGDMAVPGAPLLRIYDPSALRLEAPVRESLAVRLSVGETLRAQLDALGVRVEGRIEEIVPFADPGARTLLVKVRLPADARIFAGMFGRLEVPAGERLRLLIPARAVTQIGQLSFAVALDADGRPERRWLTLGPPAEDGRIEVLSGLAAGERVRLPAGG